MFLIFAGEQFYPRGGSNDLIASFEDLEQAKSMLPVLVKDYNQLWCHIYDTKTKCKVYEPIFCVFEE